MRRWLNWLAAGGIVLGLGFSTLSTLTELEEAALEPLPPDTRIDRIEVHKSRHELVLIADERPNRTYKVALGSGGIGPKLQEGDRKTPEGRYRINGRNPNSAFHLSLRISYPEPHEVKAARERGVSPGGDIMIHGLPNGSGWIGERHLLADWTAGCIAVTDAEIEEIWRVVKTIRRSRSSLRPPSCRAP